MRDRIAELTDEDHARRSATPHHRSLGAAVDWSLDLLSVDARAALTKPAAFADGFTIESAEWLFAADGPTPPHVATWVGELVDASLLQTTEGCGAWSGTSACRRRSGPRHR